MDSRLPPTEPESHSGDPRARSRKHAFCASRQPRGITVLELTLTVMIVGILTVMSVATYSSYKAKANVAQAVTDLGTIQTAISIFAVDNQGLPKSLADVNAQLGAMLDPWGNPYQYLNHADVKGKGKFRKDKNIVPINSDYDLYSMGPDGVSVPPLTAQPSRDDIVRANNGRFIGIASDYDP